MSATKHAFPRIMARLQTPWTPEHRGVVTAGGERLSEDLANAFGLDNYETAQNIISAAPELLWALRELVRAWDETQLPVSPRLQTALNWADDAIAKAEGR